MLGRDRLTKQRLNDAATQPGHQCNEQTEIEPTKLLPMGLPNSRKLPVLKHQACPFHNREGKGETDIQLQVRKLLDDKFTN